MSDSASSQIKEALSEALALIESNDYEEASALLAGLATSPLPLAALAAERGWGVVEIVSFTSGGLLRVVTALDEGNVAVAKLVLSVIANGL